MKTYRFLDVASTYTALRSELDAAYTRVMNAGWFVGGPELDAFEADFARYCGAQYCVGVGNGLDALVLPLRAYGIGAGDEVIVPANTFIATWLAVSMAGAKPVPVDADPATMNIDLARIEAAITPHTRAIMPVHLYGAPVVCGGLRDLASKHGLKLVEDAAQAHGGRDGDRRVGTLGDVAGFSFYPGKNLGAFGDGGAVVTDDTALADAVRMLGNYGAREKYHHDSTGGNSRLDSLQAAFLAVKLKHIDAWNRQRRAIADIYLRRLASNGDLRLPMVAPGTEAVWHLFVIRHGARDALRDKLAARGVQTALHYPIANHRSGAFAATYGAQDFPVTDAICASCLSLPIGPHLSVQEAAEIADIVHEATSEL
ncbi:MAG: DegT/DnrJ/EryC1/StrS family aminotransferase [Albidovulum sp.]